MRRIFTTAFAVFTLATAVFASGFQINEHGARALAMGNAFTGVANDASAVYFNPAGITQLYGTHFSIGATYISPKSTFTGPYPSTQQSSLKDKYFTPATFYATQSLGKNFYFGFGFNSPFGLGTEWEGNWALRYNTTQTEIRTFNFNPVVAYKVNDALSVAVGFTVSYADVLIARKLQLALMPPAVPQPMVFPDAHLELKGDDIGYGFNAAIMYKPVQDLSLGLSFRSQIKYDFEGTATTTYDPSVPAALSARFPKGSIAAPLTTPMVIAFGAAYNVTSNWTAAADFQYNGWSSYDKLEITFNDLPKVAGSNPSVSTRDFENGYIARFGTEYKLNNMFSVRGGVFYDKNPVKDARLDPTLPDADRLGISAGIGYQITPSLSVDLAYLYLSFSEREINTSEELIKTQPTPAQRFINGKYESSANLIGLSLNYSL